MMISERKTSGREIDIFLQEKLLPAIGGERLDVAAAAMLMLILVSQYPDIDADQVAEGVKGTSGYIATYIHSIYPNQGLVN